MEGSTLQVDGKEQWIRVSRANAHSICVTIYILERNAENTKGRKDCCGFSYMRAAGVFSSQSMQQRLTKRGDLGM